MNLFSFLNRQRRWSNNTFGRTTDIYARAAATIEHIESEVIEVKADPTSLEEWIDLTILSMEGAMRSGHTPHQVCMELERKFAKNQTRVWAKSEEGRATYHLEAA